MPSRSLKLATDFLALVGFISFASISCNLFYNYYSKRFGILGIIVYRMITILYVYIIPIIPNNFSSVDITISGNEING